MTEYLYLIRCNEFVKIGITNDIDYRLRTLQTGNPYSLELLEKFEYSNALKVEGILHSRFANLRVRGEWFDLKDADIEQAVKICKAFDESGMVFGDSLAAELLRSAVSYCLEAGIDVSWRKDGSTLVLYVDGVNYDPEAARLVVVEK